MNLPYASCRRLRKPTSYQECECMIRDALNAAINAQLNAQRSACPADASAAVALSTKASDAHKKLLVGTGALLEKDLFARVWRDLYNKRMAWRLCFNYLVPSFAMLIEKSENFERDYKCLLDPDPKKVSTLGMREQAYAKYSKRIAEACAENRKRGGMSASLIGMRNALEECERDHRLKDALGLLYVMSKPMRVMCKMMEKFIVHTLKHGSEVRESNEIPPELSSELALGALSSFD